MSQDETAPKLQIDTDWKAEAEAEKKRLAEQEKAKEASGDRAQPGQQLPKADIKSLMGVLASQAIMGLGAVADPKSGRVVIDLDGARFSIDLLGVLEEKTKNNLSDEEATELKQVVTELQARFVQIAQLVAQQGAAVPAIEPSTEPGATQESPVAPAPD